MPEQFPLADVMRFYGRQCSDFGSPFYAVLLARLADDVADGGLTAEFLEDHASTAGEDAVPLRLLGGVHRLVLEGSAPALASHFPSVGGDGDAAAMWPAFRHVLGTRGPELRDALTRPPQTNEVGRSVGLVGGMLVVAAETGLPLRLLELGTSAALNLRIDRYWYESRGEGVGDRASQVRFADRFEGGAPPFRAGLTIADRRGCDRDPIDAASDDGRLTLLSYVWPDQTERFALLRAALEVARRLPVTVDRADIPEWLESQLAEPTEGCSTVVFHSITWQYLDERERARVVEAFRVAGDRATPRTPVAWLRLESALDLAVAEVRLTTWPGGEERLLATTGFHGGAVQWLG